MRPIWLIAGSVMFSAFCRAETDTPGSLAYVLQADSLDKTKAAAVDRFAKCDRDWIVLDASYSGAVPWTGADLDAIRSAKSGRKVIAYISIGEAEDYRPYWRKEWGGRGKLTADAPAWLGAENPDWTGNYRVRYWQPEWQRIILGAVDGAMARGFDGVYLDIVDGFETFEREGDGFIDNRVNPETRQSFRRDMVDWVKVIAARTRLANRAALVVPQNGSQLLAHMDFLAAISAIGIEDLFTEGDKAQPASHSRYVLDELRKMTAAGKPVLVIEYPRRNSQKASVQKRARENGVVWLVTDRALKTLGVSGR